MDSGSSPGTSGTHHICIRNWVALDIRFSWVVVLPRRMSVLSPVLVVSLSVRDEQSRAQGMGVQCPQVSSLAPVAQAQRLSCS